jgi:hypothetical protein
MVKYSTLFLLAIILSFNAPAQIKYSGIINYSPPAGQDGCKYTIDADITMTLNRTNDGMDIDYDIKIVSLTGLIINGKSISAAQLPASVVQEYVSPSDGLDLNLYLRVKYSVSGGGASKTLSSSSSSSIPWYSYFGGTYSHDTKVMEAVKQKGVDLYKSGGIKITNVTIDGAIQFNSIPYAKWNEEQSKPKNQNSPGATTGEAQDDFWNDRKTASSANQQNNSKPKTTSADEIKAGIQKQTDDFWNDKKESDKKIQQQSDLRMKNVNDLAAVEDAKDNLRQTTSLNETYASVEALMTDFNNKMSQINRQVKTLTENSKAEWNSRVDASFNGANDAGWNEGLKLIGGIVNDSKEKKEKQYYQEKLEKEKQAKMKEIQETKKQMLFKLRQELFTKFKEGSLPLSSTKVDVSTLYYFVYAYDPAQLNADVPLLYVSNIFPIGKYGDGTWPFKSSITSELATLSPYDEKLNGYYLSEEEARVMQQGLIDIFKKTNGSVQMLTYKGKAASGSSGNSGDFWGTGNKETKSVETKPVNNDNKADDFWETGTKNNGPVKIDPNSPITVVDYSGVTGSYREWKTSGGKTGTVVSFNNTEVYYNAVVTISSGGVVINEITVLPANTFKGNISATDLSVTISWEIAAGVKETPAMLHFIRKVIRDHIQTDANGPRSLMDPACMCVRG